MYSLSDLDVAKACETPYEFEVKDDDTGKGTGIFLSVIGGHAQVIADFIAKKLNERRTAEAMAEKRDPRGKRPHVFQVEEDIEYNIEQIALRVVGWRGISDPYSHAAAVKLCTINPSIKDQVLAVSEDLKKYPTRFSTSSASSSGNQPG